MADRKEGDEWSPRTWDELFPGKYLKHSHLNPQGTALTFERVVNRIVDGELAQVVKFSPVPGIAQVDWGLNKTNGLCLRAMFGDDIPAWAGKSVVVKPAVVEHGREKGKPCIRICASSDIEADIPVVIDFKTKRIKPFVIRVRAIKGKATAKPKQDASAEAVELAGRFRAAATIEDLTAVALDVETALEHESITRDESRILMEQIEKQGKALAEKAAANVIS